MSTTKTAGSYKSGELIAIQINFSEVVNVSGVPKLTMNTGAVVNYSSGSGTSTLVFNYTVGAGQNTSALDHDSTSALVLNGGTILDAALNQAALALPALASASTIAGTTTIKVDTSAPQIAGMPSVPVTVNGSYTVSPSVTDNQAVSSYAWTAPPANITNGCTVSFSSASIINPSITFSSCANNGNGNYGSALITLTASDVAGNTGSSSFTLNWDQETPSVSSIDVPAANITTKYFKSGAVIPINVTFTKNASNPTAGSFSLSVTGVPTLALSTGGDATYSSTGSTSKVLRFNYTVQSNDFSLLQSGGLLNLANSAVAISLNGGTIQDNTGTFNNAKLTNLPYNGAGILGVGVGANTGALTIDTVPPTVGFASGTPSGQSKNLSWSFTTYNSGSNAPATAANKDTHTVQYVYVSGGAAACTAANYTGPVSASGVISSASCVGCAGVLSDRTTFPDGTATLCALGTDLAGNTQISPSTATWTIDTTPPASIAISSPTNGQRFATQPVSVSWTPAASDVDAIDLILSTKSDCAAGIIESYLVDTNTQLAGGTGSLTFLTSNLADGLYYVCMYTYDVARNKSSMSSTSFEIETDSLHVSWTDNGGIKYATRSGVGSWIVETVANIGTMDARTSLAVNKDGAALVAFQYDDGSQAYYTYRRRTGANSWLAPSNPLITNPSAYKTGLYGEIALNNANSSNPKIFASSYGYEPDSAAEGLMLTDSTGSKQLRISTSAVTPTGVNDSSITLDVNNTVYIVASVLNGSNYGLKIDNPAQGTTADVTLPSSCQDAPYVSAFARGAGVVGMAIACRMSNDNSCRIYWGESTYASFAFSFSSWTQVGIVKSSSCAQSDLTAYTRPSIVYDRVNNNRVSIAWVNKDNNTLNRWSNENSGSAVTDPILTMNSSQAGQPSIALDKTGKSYVIYQDGDSVMMVTNNSRPSGAFTGAWSTPSSIITGNGVQGLGNIGVTGMKGRSNTLNGN